MNDQNYYKGFNPITAIASYRFDKKRSHFQWTIINYSLSTIN